MDLQRFVQLTSRDPRFKSLSLEKNLCLYAVNQNLGRQYEDVFRCGMSTESPRSRMSTYSRYWLTGGKIYALLMVPRQGGRPAGRRSREQLSAEARLGQERNTADAQLRRVEQLYHGYLRDLGCERVGPGTEFFKVPEYRISDLRDLSYLDSPSLRYSPVCIEALARCATDDPGWALYTFAPEQIVQVSIAAAARLNSRIVR